MKKSDINRQLRNEGSRFVPDNKEQIMKKLSIEPQPKFKRKAFKLSFKFSLAFTIVLVSIIGFSLALTTPVAASNSIVMIEINPSFELELDKEDKIVDIRGLNLDGILVLESLDSNNWNDLSNTEIINNIVDFSIKLGYLNENNNNINLSAINTNLKKETAVANIFRTELENTIENCQLEIVIRNNNDNQEYKSLAKTHKISVGKMNLIQRALQIDNSLTIDKAKEMTPKQLNEIINQYNRQKNREFKENFEKQKQAFKQYKKRIHQELKEYHNNFKQQIEVIKELIDNHSPKEEVEVQLLNLIQFLNMDNYNFNSEGKDDLYDYYLDVLEDIKDYANDYYDDLVDYIEDQLEESNSNLREYVKERISDNPNDFNFEFDFDDDLIELIKNRGHGKQNGYNGRN